MVTNGDVTSGGGWVAGRSCWWSVLAWRIFYDGDLLLRRIGDMVVDRGEKGWCLGPWRKVFHTAAGREPIDPKKSPPVPRQNSKLEAAARDLKEIRASFSVTVQNSLNA
ncbi:hypothetical protein NC653_000805 [Populus alba x Populus x berolinensis]|uniref:Uncharacterized protein n=1 Tax=Populus alba x Populus x berolinensis TaxID=444605 RepID=A0AAD6RJZ4_9ROSI|nr:hypothetical protein NC653_000805 [Populus alba x Populus x berolinensis]